MLKFAHVFLLTFSILALSVVSSFAQDDADGAPESLVMIDDEGMKAERSPDLALKDKDRPLTLEEAQDLIYARPAALHAIDGGEVSLSDESIYNIYARQLAYRESAKKFRTSLEARRVSFEEPRTAIVEEHREIVDKVYGAETMAFQEKAKDKKKPRASKAKTSIKAKQTVAKKANADKMNAAAQSSDHEHIDLKEMPIPSPEVGQEEVRRKVVTDPSAPNFDPSKL